MTELRLNGEGAGAARAIPLGDDWISRRLREIDERITQNLAAMRVMVEPLAQAISDVAAMIEQQVAGTSDNNYVTGVSVGTTFASYAPVSLSVPSGFTRAHVLGVSSLRSAAAPMHSIQVRIAGVDSEQFTNSNGETPVTAVFTREVTGLSGGSLVVETRAAGVGSTLSANIWTNAMAIFLR